MITFEKLAIICKRVATTLRFEPGNVDIKVNRFSHWIHWKNLKANKSQTEIRISLLCAENKQNMRFYPNPELKKAPYICAWICASASLQYMYQCINPFSIRYWKMLWQVLVVLAHYRCTAFPWWAQWILSSTKTYKITGQLNMKLYAT